MESCTGGKLCSEITNISDSSVIFKFGAVTYSNFYKVKMGVDEGKINNYGVYSTEVACEMAKKISIFADSDYGIGITGKLNCPDTQNPLGKNDIVYVSIYDREKNQFFNFSVDVISEDRESNKNMVVTKVAEKLLENIQ